MYDPAAFYSIIDHQFFETPDRYKPSRELVDLVERICGTGWKLSAGGFWCQCLPISREVGSQGWKIHVSGTEYTAAELIRRVVPILVEESVPFKFCSDLNVVKISTSKNAHRTAAGKFITAYPSTTELFVHVIKRCDEATRDLVGPYILTDRPYGESKTIFYRYGGHGARFRTDSQGLHIPVVQSPKGDLVPDERTPFFQVPDWATDPFPDTRSGSTSETKNDLFLKKGQYRINGVLTHSSHGGVYTGLDTRTAEEVVIREARPMLGRAKELLLKEARILRRLEETCLAPRCIDLFEEWDHLFLVQERLHAQWVWHYALGFLFGPDYPTPVELFNLLKQTIKKIAAGLEEVHRHEIVLRDFTKTNVLITQDLDERVKFVDFELAYEMDRDDPPLAGGTWGYASPQQFTNSKPQMEDDFFALGSIILDMIAFSAPELVLNRAGALVAFRQTLDDLGLPPVFAEIVTMQTDPCPARRHTPTQVIRMLDCQKLTAIKARLDPLISPVSSCSSVCQHDPMLDTELRSTITGISTYIISKLDFERPDRLCPASTELFLTNPVCIRFGAAGIANFLWEASGVVPREVNNWIVAQSNPEYCPPGLLNGLSGVAVVLLRMGATEQATRLLELSNNDERIYEEPGLFEGAAGWGLANLHFWCATKEKLYLERALQVGERLLRWAKRDESGAFWDTRGEVLLGLGSGSSGIGLFLLYLNAVDQRDQFLSVAEAAIDHDIAHVTWTRDRVDLHSVKGEPTNATKSPHMRHGSLGVGTAALRLHSVTKRDKYLRFAKSCCTTASSRVTNKLWQDWGLAGFGEFLLDSFQFLKDPDFLEASYYIAEGILPHRIVKPEGVAFPGNELLRISCDWGLGSAGIGLFLDRLVNPEKSRFLFLDEILR